MNNNQTPKEDSYIFDSYLNELIDRAMAGDVNAEEELLCMGHHEDVRPCQCGSGEPATICGSNSQWCG